MRGLSIGDRCQGYVNDTMYLDHSFTYALEDGHGTRLRSLAGTSVDPRLSEAHDVLKAVVENPAVRLVMGGLEHYQETEEGIACPDSATIDHAIDTGHLATMVAIGMGLNKRYVMAAATAGVILDSAKGIAEQGVAPHASRWREHPPLGAALAKEAGMDHEIVTAVNCHHGFGFDSYGGDPTDYFPEAEGVRHLPPGYLVAAIAAGSDFYQLTRSRLQGPDQVSHGAAVNQMFGGMSLPGQVVRSFDDLPFARGKV